MEKSNDCLKPAVNELKEFLRERQEVSAAEELGKVEPTKAFREKWFNRYPQFNEPRRGLFNCFNLLQEHLEEKAYPLTI